MKRAIVALSLGVIVVAAVLVVKDLGLFRHSPSYPGYIGGPPMMGGGPTMGGPGFAGSGMGGGSAGGGVGFASSGPGFSSSVPLMGAPMISFPGAGSGASVMSESEIDKVRRDWTYPGATDATYEFVNPRTSPQQIVKQWGKYTRFLDAFGPPAKVWQFYRARAGVDPGPANPASQEPLGSHSHGVPIAANEISSSVGGMSYGSFSRSEKDYMINAALTYQAGQNHTRIILQLVPRTFTSSHTPRH